MSGLDWLTDPSGLTPHGFCLAWSPWLIGLHAASDLLTGLAYVSISLALTVFVRRRKDIAFSWMFGLFAAFILACGATHFLDVATLWIPAYGIAGVVKLITALLSVVTAAALWPLLPAAVALPSPADHRALNSSLEVEVAEREAVAARLRDSEARFRALYAKTPAPLLATDPNRKIVAVSERPVELLGRSRNALIGQDVLCLGVTASVGAMDQAWATLQENGNLRDCEFRLLGPDGAEIDVQMSAALEREAGGSVLAVAVVTDITGRKMAECALRTAQESLQQAQKMEAIGQLTGGIAHDFNNMLTVIGGSLEVIRRREPGDSGCERLIELAQQGVDKAARLTSQLLSFSRRQRLEPAALDPHEVICGMRALLERTVGERITLEVAQPAAGAWWCLADRNQLEAALLNLALNARAAIEGQGILQIAVFAQRLAETGAAMHDLAQGDYVVISVIDDGPGIDPAIQPQIFEPFFTTKPRGEGTGLGLAQIYGFVRQSGGQSGCIARQEAVRGSNFSCPAQVRPPEWLSDKDPAR